MWKLRSFHKSACCAIKLILMMLHYMTIQSYIRPLIDQSSYETDVYAILLCNCCRRGKTMTGHQVISSEVPAMNTSAAQLTEDNEDFADRVRYHQSEVIKGQAFETYYQGD